MSTKISKWPAGTPMWVDLSVDDVEAAKTFYTGLFGWEFEDVMPEGADGHYFVGRIRGGDVGAVGSGSADTPPVPVAEAGD